MRRILPEIAQKVNFGELVPFGEDRRLKNKDRRQNWLRTMTENDAEFRKWPRTPNPTIGKRKPMELIKSGQWQALADKVDDMLTGAST
jgi:hypothetical protein